MLFKEILIGMDRNSQSQLLVGTRPESSHRFGEINKLLPVAFVIAMIAVLYLEYVFIHCARLLQWDLSPNARNKEDEKRGMFESCIFHVITGFLMYCLAKCILTHPGTIPDGEGWELQPDVEEKVEGKSVGQFAGMLEKKHTGERRHCKWCLKYKPDRTHHCRICSICVLRMDHHCPWVYNCIGFRNYKYFFLVLVYAIMDLSIINLTMFESVWWSTRTDVSVSIMLFMMFGATLAGILWFLVSGFLGFHIWLMCKALTTVEFCEKSLRNDDYNTSMYSMGLYEDICAALGPRPLLWLLPVSHPEGNGVSFGPKVITNASQGQEQSNTDE